MIQTGRFNQTPLRVSLQLKVLNGSTNAILKSFKDTPELKSRLDSAPSLQQVRLSVECPEKK